MQLNRHQPRIVIVITVELQVLVQLLPTFLNHGRTEKKSGVGISHLIDSYVAKLGNPTSAHDAW
jgi:hypothetical protein